MFLKRAIEFTILNIAYFGALLAFAEEQKMPEKYSQSEMRKLVIDSLEKSDVDMERMRDWVFSEDEVFINEKYVVNYGKIEADKDLLPSFRKEYAWFVRDGVFVRSPMLINGVAVNSAQKTAAEENWFKEEKKNAGRKGLLDYYFDFVENYLGSIWKKPPRLKVKQNAMYYPFTSGKFSYGGEKIIEGHKVTEIQYKPSLTDLMGKHAPKEFSTFASTFNLILFIIPEEHQIVKLARGSESVPVEAFTSILSLTMDKWGEGIWLPRKFSSVHFSDATPTKGKFYYTREYHSFAKAKVNTNVTFDGIDDNKEDHR